MATLLIRHLDDRIRDALRSLAKSHGRSVEAEVRDILGRATEARPKIDWAGIPSVSTGRSGPVTRDEINLTYEADPS